MDKKPYVLGVRMALTAALLVVVWMHAHWSVALMVTLLAMANECTGLVVRRSRHATDSVEAVRERIAKGGAR
jgi:hypothetical protein